MDSGHPEQREQDDLTEGETLRDDTRVLVAVINDPRDLEIARVQGWYRIPLLRAPSRVGADYLAFYQTKIFGEEAWAINYYAPIKRFLIVSRQDLLPDQSDHPRAKERYYKIEIGPLRRLPNPIPSHRLRRITFIPTTLKHLLRAEEINDLWPGTPAEERLWQAFKENGLIAERCYCPGVQDERARIDFALYCQEGNIAVFFEREALVENLHIIHEETTLGDYDLAAGGWTVLRLRAHEVNRSLPACLGAVLSAVDKHGGVLPVVER